MKDGARAPSFLLETGMWMNGPDYIYDSTTTIGKRWPSETLNLGNFKIFKLHEAHYDH